MVFLGMKRGREGELDSITTMANCLMLLSRSAGATAFESATTTTSPSRVFECKTCSRQFPSFQALGGHRASHKKPRLMGGGDMNIITQTSPPKPKTHECSICGLEFAIGQALGGHMRRHRAAATATATTALSSDSHVTDLSLSSSQSQEQVPVVKKSNSRTVLCLDLNLTPLENDSDLVPMIHCFL